MLSNYQEYLAIYGMGSLETECDVITHSLWCHRLYGDLSALVGHGCKFAKTLMGFWTFLQG